MERFIYMTCYEKKWDYIVLNHVLQFKFDCGEENDYFKIQLFIHICYDVVL